ncbi:hypothetical protein [Candidatus Tisiphia endosymbiont of Nemotelus uliginosus]|uniref:hypothetical protein n=1 Tax=Candidatus Tisiphia endosymbiont of Nemotelus uliginosus TaxID=3077926 RepID=UPI0035C9116A
MSVPLPPLAILSPSFKDELEKVLEIISKWNFDDVGPDTEELLQKFRALVLTIATIMEKDAKRNINPEINITGSTDLALLEPHFHEEGVETTGTLSSEIHEEI